MLASAAVRLYKLNPDTGGYDSHAGGVALGCVVLGGGDKYNILVYNSEKVPQLVVPLQAGLSYNLRDLYVSIADSNGTNWSLLFDTVENLNNVLRLSMAAAAQVAGQKLYVELFYVLCIVCERAFLPPIKMITIKLTIILK